MLETASSVYSGNLLVHSSPLPDQRQLQSENGAARDSNTLRFQDILRCIDPFASLSRRQNRKLPSIDKKKKIWKHDLIQANAVICSYFHAKKKIKKDAKTGAWCLKCSGGYIQRNGNRNLCLMGE